MEKHKLEDPELESLFAEDVSKCYHIYFHEGTLFAYMLVDNIDYAMSRLAEHPVNVKWQAFFSDLLKV